MIREVDPPRPSARVSTLQAKALSTVVRLPSSANRARLSQQLRGELDWIVMKALEKDRRRRYESASAFAADVQRISTMSQSRPARRHWRIDCGNSQSGTEDC